MKQIRENLGLNLIIAIAAGVLFGAFIPLSTYISNSQEFKFVTKWDMLGISGIVFVIFFLITLILLCVLSKLNKTVHGYAVAVISGLAIAIYTEGNIIGAKYPVLDGKSIPWKDMVGIGISNTVVWLLIIYIAVFSYRKWKDESLSVFKNIMLAFTAFMVIFGGLRFAELKQDSVGTALFTDKHFYEASSNGNVFVFVLDSFERPLFEELLEKDPETKEILKDFTYYQNTIGKYPTTMGALPHIITGIVNDNTYTFRQYLDHAYEKSELLNRAKEENYKVHLYASPYFAPNFSVLKNSGCVDNYIMKGQNSYNNLLDVFTSVYNNSLFTYVPHFLKKPFSSYEPKKKIDLSKKEELGPFVVTAMLDAVGKNKQLVKVNGDKFCNIYHLAGVHFPNDNVKTAKENILIIKSFIQELKRLNVYDKSTMVVLADHGLVQVEKPIFLLKTNQGKLTTQTTPFSYADLNHLFAQLLTDPNARPKISDKDRIFYYYSWDGKFSNAYLPKLEKRVFALNAKNEHRKLSKFANWNLSNLEAKNFSSDKAGRWSLKKDNSITIPLMETLQNQDIVITLNTMACITSKFTSQEVTFYVNGVELKQEIYNHPKTVHKKVTLSIPKQHNQREDLVLRCVVKKPISPKEIGASDDVRTLGVYITEIDIKPAK